MVQENFEDRLDAQVPGKAWLRSQRVFFLNDGWYFQTREAGNVGPFHSQTEADSYVKQVVDFLQLRNNQTKSQFFKNIAA